ncbi:MAG TPA: TIGR04376 family protein [Candidatus Caenarcaniphilales bacterium]
MGLFDDFNAFLEARLEEFLRNNPQLELQALAENVREQQEDTSRLIKDLQAQEKQLQTEILNTAQEIQRWHTRTQKAQAAGRQDLAQAAQEREAALLRQGNQRWGQMEVLKERIKQTEELQRKIQTRQQEVQQKIAQAEATARTTRSTQDWQASSGWYHNPHTDPDPLEEKFKRWEMDEELEELKRSMGR